MDPMIEDAVGLLIAIIAIAGSMTIAIVSIWLAHKKKKLVLENIHAERMAAIEKGIDLPPSRVEMLISDRQNNPLRRGITLTLVGITVCSALYYTHHEGWVWGLPITAVGVSNLIYFYLVSAKTERP
jgi:Domain of unknown function (DUF6249)